MEKNLYEILEISREASNSEIKRAYAKQLRKYPPEKFTKEFSIINSAYEVLSNEEKRYEYSRLNGYEYTSQRILEDGLKCIEEGKIIEGRNLLNNFLKREGEVFSVLHEIGKTYALEGKYEKALKIQESILEKEKFISFEEMDCMIEYLYKLDEEVGVEIYIKKAIEKFRDIATYYNIVDLYIKDKKYEKAKILLVEKGLPFIRKDENIYDYCNIAKILFQIGENEEAGHIILEGLNIETNDVNEIEEKLESIKELIVEVLDFKNAKYLEVIIGRQIEYVNSIRTKIKESVYLDNIGWTTISKVLIGDMASVNKADFNELLRRFLLVSVKKRIAIDIETRDYMDDRIIEYLYKLKEEDDLKRIKDNLMLLEKFHEELYSLDAKYLFDKYGGFVPYFREVSSKKRGRNSKNSSGVAIFIILGIVIIIALVYFI